MPPPPAVPDGPPPTPASSSPQLDEPKARTTAAHASRCTSLLPSAASREKRVSRGCAISSSEKSGGERSGGGCWSTRVRSTASTVARGGTLRHDTRRTTADEQPESVSTTRSAEGFITRHHAGPAGAHASPKDANRTLSASSRAHSPLRSRPALTNVHTQIVTRPSRSHTWEAQSLRTRHVTHRRPRGASTRRAPSAPARGLTHPSRGRRRRARHLRARPLPPLPATAVASSKRLRSSCSSTLPPSWVCLWAHHGALRAPSSCSTLPRVGEYQVNRSMATSQ